MKACQVVDCTNEYVRWVNVTFTSKLDTGVVVEHEDQIGLCAAHDLASKPETETGKFPMHPGGKK